MFPLTAAGLELELRIEKINMEKGAVPDIDNSSKFVLLFIITSLHCNQSQTTEQTVNIMGSVAEATVEVSFIHGTVVTLTGSWVFFYTFLWVCSTHLSLVP